MNQEHILVVDDEQQMLRSVERVLASRYPVATARTPPEALERARTFQPDLAILDVRMPEMDGFELMRRLREVRPGLDVVFMTGVVHELDAQIIRSIREKAFYFIQKPFDREVLLTLVARCVELRRLAGANKRYVARLEDHLEQARNFQRGLLPSEEARIAGTAIAARYRPCDDLGGDFYDFASTDDGRVSLLIADVCGHGVSAAMLTSIVKSAFHDARVDAYEPLAVVHRVGNGLRSFDAQRFVTLACVRVAVSERYLEFVNAGHPPGLLWGPRGRRALAPTGPLVSPAFADLKWDQARLELVPGDQLLLFTDGITEARGDVGWFGEERLEGEVARAPGPGGVLLDAVLKSVADFSGGRPRADDWTLLTLRLE